LPLRLGECNSVSSGGTAGVSDVFASALWGVDFLFDAAALGVAGINFHGGFGQHGYTPLCLKNGHYQACPLYYGMLLFHAAGRGRTVPTDGSDSRNLAVHAVLGDDGKLRVVLINKDLLEPVTVSVAPGLPAAKWRWKGERQGQLLRLLAPSVTSAEGITLAGSAVRPDGTWAPQAGEPVRSVQGRFALTLPPASAAWLTIN
jgi:hypothetical protein